MQAKRVDFLIVIAARYFRAHGRRGDNKIKDRAKNQFCVFFVLESVF
jgi:hypothetical protein